MMMWTLKLDPAFKKRLWSHLLPDASDGERVLEQAAFLYCKPCVSPDGVFQVIESDFMGERDFTAQCSDYLELSGTARARVIKRTHSLGASLTEVHSHPSTWPAEFSWSDRSGLRETVPHMRWRLKGRPYLALVVARTTFDALMWEDEEEDPVPLRGIEVAGVLYAPTNFSYGSWSRKAAWDG
jgi:hypothetical protein